MATKKNSKKSAETEQKTKEQKFSRNLVCILTREEREAYSTDLANKIGEQGQLEAEFDNVKKSWKQKLETVDLDVHSLSSKVRENRELRNVKCKRVFNYGESTVTECRSDTGEVIEVRDMTDSERQEELDFGDNDPDSDFDNGTEDDQ
jgi:hypothetical protein